jgi:hypothetical protein
MKVRDQDGQLVGDRNDIDVMQSIAREVTILTRLSQLRDHGGIMGFYGAFETDEFVALILECGQPK